MEQSRGYEKWRQLLTSKGQMLDISNAFHA